MSLDQKKIIEQIVNTSSQQTVQGKFVPAEQAAAFCKAGCNHHCTG